MPQQGAAVSNLGDDIDRLALLERREEILARRLKEAKRRRIAQEHEVYDRMIAEGWLPNKSSFNRNGFKFRPKAVDYAVVQDAEKLRPWLASYDEGIIEEKFKKGELNRIVREKLDNGEPLPPGLGSFTKTEVGKSGIMHTEAVEEADDAGEE